MNATTNQKEQFPGHIPGEAGIWVLVLGDMLAFGLIFGAYTWYRAQNLAIYLPSQATLDQTIGVINTLLLLTSSWFVAQGVHAARHGSRALARRSTLLALACGLGFVAVKFFEYGAKIKAGITLTTNEFYMFYYVMTGIHLVHVVIGIALLIVISNKLKVARAWESDRLWVESSATYWHMVDLLWIVLFPLLYLLR